MLFACDVKSPMSECLTTERRIKPTVLPVEPTSPCEEGNFLVWSDSDNDLFLQRTLETVRGLGSDKHYVAAGLGSDNMANKCELLKPSLHVRAKDAERLLPKMGRDPDCVMYACATQIKVVTGGKTEPKLSIRSFIGNTVSLYLFLRNQEGDSARSFDGGAGRGSWRKRRPLCNAKDRGCDITSRESGQTSTGSLLTRNFGQPFKGESRCW